MQVGHRAARVSMSCLHYLRPPEGRKPGDLFSALNLSMELSVKTTVWIQLLREKQDTVYHSWHLGALTFQNIVNTVL